MKCPGAKEAHARKRHSPFCKKNKNAANKNTESILTDSFNISKVSLVVVMAVKFPKYPNRDPN